MLFVGLYTTFGKPPKNLHKKVFFWPTLIEDAEYVVSLERVFKTWNSGIEDAEDVVISASTDFLKPEESVKLIR